MGITYFFTFGLLGISRLKDLFRMSFLVQEANSLRVRHQGQSYSQLATHLLAFSPAGLLGAHHFYLHRPLWGFLYFCTMGLLGIGWLFDWFRTSCLVKRANAIGRGERSCDRKYLDDAYILCFPLGFLGLHHFYLRRYCWGVLYFCTVGIFGIGWLIDLFRLPCLLKEYHAHLELSQPLTSPAHRNGHVATSSGMALIPAQVASTASVYGPGAGYGDPQTPSCPPADYVGASYPAYMEVQLGFRRRDKDVLHASFPNIYRHQPGPRDTHTCSVGKVI